MTAILYYITGHGFGHAVRSHQVIRALASARADLRIHVRTTAPEWLFLNSPTPVAYSQQALDVGVIQSDSLRLELSATLAACQKFYGNSQGLIEQELTFVTAHDIQLIIGDTPPVCFEIAERAGIGSVSITNFTWDFIYRAYVDEYPTFAPLIKAMTAYYSKTSLALTLPYPCDTGMFPRQKEIPWVTRRSSMSKAAARAKFDLPHSATIILLSFGGLGLGRLPWERLKQQQNFLFVATGDAKRSEGNIVVLPDTQSQYEDLIRAVDAIVTKPGYGIVADVLAHQLPILYTDRGHFPEYPRLVEALRDCATVEYIPQTELLAGNLTPYLTRLLTKSAHWPKLDLNGAEVAARHILKLLTERS